jgi:hypothetical protein
VRGYTRAMYVWEGFLAKTKTKLSGLSLLCQSARLSDKTFEAHDHSFFFLQLNPTASVV